MAHGQDRVGGGIRAYLDIEDSAPTMRLRLRMQVYG